MSLLSPAERAEQNVRQRLERGEFVCCCERAKLEGECRVSSAHQHANYVEAYACESAYSDRIKAALLRMKP